MFTRSLAPYKRRGIRINVLCPEVNLYIISGIVVFYYNCKLFLLYNLPLNLDVVCSNRDGRKSGFQIYFSIWRLCANGNGGQRYIYLLHNSFC